MALAALTLSGLAGAQAYPTKNVTLLVPFAAGSSTDIMTRLVAKGLNERLKTSHFIVDNKPGANDTIASDVVAKARPDGYTILIGTGTTHTQVPWMMKSLFYDPVKDFEPVAGIGGVPLAVMVANSSPIRTMDDLRKTVAASPGKYAYGTAFGMATVCGENIRRGFNIDLVQVPYKSSPQAITDLIGGRFSFMFADTSTALPQVPGVDLGYRPAHVDVVRKAMVGVTQSGTSTRVFAGARYLSGGKTGTAQAVTIGQKDRYNAARMEERQRDHSLYIAFAPADAPRIAVAAIVENAGFGAAHAAPIVRRVFDYWLLGEYPSEEDMAAVRKGLASAPLGKPRPVADVPLTAP